MIPRLIYYTPPSGHQIEEQYRSCDNQQKVDPAAADMKAETEQSQDQHDHENYPEHMDPRPTSCAPEE
jgi:hypothetical protein